MAGSLLAPTTQDLIQRDQTASGQTVAGPRTCLTVPAAQARRATPPVGLTAYPSPIGAAMLINDRPLHLDEPSTSMGTSMTTTIDIGTRGIDPA